MSDSPIVPPGLPKLVRDNIPQIIHDASHVEPKIRVAKDDAEFRSFLLKKTVEEAVEVYDTKGNKSELLKELADMRELLMALMQLENITESEIEKIRLLKKAKNGGFEKRYIFEGK
jgi:predicted house-cleaning noncanonical NTP pyrophosphatase (MazG superfamily)